MLTPEELRQIQRLSVQAGRRVDSLFAGGYRSAFKGRGMEFDEVRTYVEGDDVRHIDWNVTARTDEPHVKVFQEERELTMMIAIDVSASMAFGSGGRDRLTDKRLQQARVAGALAYAAIRNNDRVGLMAFSDQVELFVPPRKSRGHAWRVIREVFGHSSRGTKTDVPGAMEELSRSLKRRAVVCVVSDFLGDDPYRALSVLSAKHRTHCFVLTDPLERKSPDVGLLEVVDSESGERILMDTGAWTHSDWLNHREKALRSSGAYVSSISTDADPFMALMKHFREVERMR